MNWFTADPHFGHDNILRFGLERSKDFTDISEWDSYVIDKIREKVTPKVDRLFILGDFTCGADPQPYKCKIGREIWLIHGNHDKSISRCSEVFGHMNVRDTFVANVWNTPIFLSHYAHAYWPGSHKGHFHAYGHTHAQREATLDSIWPERRSLDVGLDNAKKLLGDYVPFSEDDIYHLLKDKRGHDEVEFYQKVEV